MPTPEWTEHPDLVAFYRNHRNQPEDLYPSERRFLPWLAGQAESVLDVGCAVGGFLQIWRSYNPRVLYRGVDASGPLVEAARRLHPDAEFLQAECVAGVPLPDSSATVVQALGYLPLEPAYGKSLAELWRLTDRALFFDVRLRDAPDDLIGEQRIALTGEWDGTTRAPYVCVSWPRFGELLLELEPTRILGYGYWGLPAETVVGVDPEVCFATFVLENGAPGTPEVCLDMPLEWPPHLADRVALLASGRLEDLVPV